MYRKNWLASKEIFAALAAALVPIVISGCVTNKPTALHGSNVSAKTYQASQSQAPELFFDPLISPAIPRANIEGVNLSIDVHYRGQLVVLDIVEPIHKLHHLVP